LKGEARGPWLSSVLVALQGVILTLGSMVLLLTGSASVRAVLLTLLGVALLICAARLHRGSRSARTVVVFYEVALLVLSVLALLIGQVLLPWGLLIGAVVLWQLLRSPTP